jgi:hypothetical protein
LGTPVALTGQLIDITQQALKNTLLVHQDKTKQALFFDYFFNLMLLIVCFTLYLNFFGKPGLLV